MNRVTTEQYQALVELRNRTAKRDRVKRESKPKQKRKTQAQHLAKFMAAPRDVPVMTNAQREAQLSLFERHEHAKIAIRMPLPPSVNSYRAIFTPKRGRPRLITSTAGRAYDKAVAARWKQHNGGVLPEPLTARIRVVVIVTAATAAEMDLDNRLKPLLDAMTNAGVYRDDSLIDQLGSIRGGVCSPGFVDVFIETI